MRQSGLVLTMAALLFAACAKVVVLPVKTPADPKLNTEGVFYALPKTVVRVDVKIDRTVLTAAPYMHFAAIFAPGSTPVCSKVLPLGETPKPDEENVCVPAKEGAPPTHSAFALQQGAKLSTFGEPDPDNVFVVTFTNGGALDQSLSMTWNEAGLLSLASSTVTNRTTDIVMSGLKLVASVSAKGGLGAADVAEAVKDEECPAPYGRSNSDSWVLPILNKNGGEAAGRLMSNYCEIQPNKDGDRIGLYVDKKKSEDLLKLATLAYVKRVWPLLSDRDTYLGGSSNASDPKPMIDKLDALIASQLEALYLGSTTTKSWDGSLEVRDLDPANQAKVLAVASKKGVCIDGGLLAPDSKVLPDGFPAKDNDCTGGNVFYLRLVYYPSKAAQLSTVVDGGVKAPDSDDRGFRYYIPARMNAQLMQGTESNAKSFGGGVISVAQLGHLVSLPARRRSKALTYDLAFIESTGALKTFKLGTTGGLDAATVDALAAASGTVLDARNAERVAEKAAADAALAAETAAADELTQLTRQHALLKLRDEICTLQRKYGLECTFQP